MCQHAVRWGHPRGDRSHSGWIRTERPDEFWGTDASRFWTKAEGWRWSFAAADHCTSNVVGERYNNSWLLERHGYMTPALAREKLSHRKAEVVLRLLRGEDIGEVSREVRVAPPELGEMTMRVELQSELLEKRGYGDELWKLLRRLGG